MKNKDAIVATLQQLMILIQKADEKPEEPIKRKRGRPKKQIETTSQEKPAVEESTTEEKLVTLFVSPVMTIQDVRYGGNVTVPASIASQLRHMMDRVQAYERKTQTFVDHGVRDHGAF